MLKLLVSNLNLLCYYNIKDATPCWLNPYSFPIRTDYIFTCIKQGAQLPLSIAYSVLPCGIVVEPSPLRGLVADCPIYIVFKHSHLGIFHPYVVANIALRGFQQFNAFNVSYSINPRSVIRRSLRPKRKNSFS